MLVVPNDKQSVATAREDETALVAKLTGGKSDLKTLTVGTATARSPSVNPEKDAIVVRAFGNGGQAISLKETGIETLRIEQASGRLEEQVSAVQKPNLALLPDLSKVSVSESKASPATVVVLTGDNQYFEFAASAPAKPKPQKKKPKEVVPTENGKPEAEGCGHDTAIPIPLKGQPGRIACAYLMNAYNEELAEYQRQTITEDELVGWISQCGKDCQNVHPYQTSPHTQWYNRVSSSGVLVFRVFGEFGHPMAIDSVKGVKIQIYADEDIRLSASPAGPQTSYSVQMSAHISKSDFGDSIKVEVLYEEKKLGDRYSWYRPQSGWALDYTIATFAVTADGWKFRNTGKLAFAPAMVRVQYRRYMRSSSRTDYVFWNVVGLGPIIAAADDDSSNSSGLQVPGFIATTGVDIGGFDIGFGTTMNWEGNVKFQPVITLNLTEAFTRAFGWSGTYPDSLVESGKDSEAKGAK